MDLLDNDVLTATEDSTALGGDGGDATNGGTAGAGGDATAEEGETSIGGDGGDAIGRDDLDDLDQIDDDLDDLDQIGDQIDDDLNDLDQIDSDDDTDSNNDILSVFRFFENEKGFHFYTSSEEEKDTVQDQIEDGELTYQYEGESFAALAEDDDGDPLTGAKPVYRFFNSFTGAHLYTISETEKNNIVDNLADYNLEGVAYYAYDEPQEDTIPLYRLYNSETGTHFFTPSASEKDNVLDALPAYSEEGDDSIAFHVLPSDL
ncbi:MAG: hypothetical protein AAF383_09120 [Cyanobacteria bacterium P01_A01_bin.83]